MANLFSLALTFGLVFSSLSSMTAASLQLTNDCNYVFFQAPYSVDVCWERQDSTGKESSVKFICNTEKNITFQKWEKASCSGSPSEEKSLNDFANDNNIPTSSLKWKCDGTKSAEECGAYRREYNFSSSAKSCKDWNGFFELTYVLNTCVGYNSSGTNESIALTCANDNITLFFFDNYDCTPSPLSYNESHGSVCGGTSGDYYKTDVRCSISAASPVSVSIALLFAIISLVFS
ncbi:hypothetical protein RFI_26269 [Reticulomyxa filosa]|uniref:Uncharacterized protein n=1 Tax=Reticulomyxa filosa TaxID=46433 RepID=X6MCD8_RETFI|nr:hypothetical protein RFI_26269 [Reticulomyxa filosa]|eukprot:ETO11107.1 hypothetical protein RFI_26269 [Reticulomyxa filosa]